MLSILMLAGTKVQEMNPAHNKSQHPQESPGHCTNTHLPALHQHGQKSYWCCFCGVLIAGYWSFVCGDKMQVHRAAREEQPG